MKAFLTDDPKLGQRRPESRSAFHAPQSSAPNGRATHPLLEQQRMMDEGLSVQRLSAVADTLHGTIAEPLQRLPAPAPGNEPNGLPTPLKAGVESLSGMSMDHVEVHYNSSKPAQLNALAYTQGSDIHVGPGQERHLSHEAWHVVQQAQGRVEPTHQLAGVAINDQSLLEREADVMGRRALDAGGGESTGGPAIQRLGAIQRMLDASTCTVKPFPRYAPPVAQMRSVAPAVVQRMTKRVERLAFQVKDVFKKVRAMLITEAAATHFSSSYDIDELQSALDTARAKFEAFERQDRIEETDTRFTMNYLTENQPLYIAGDTLYLDSGLMDGDLGTQAAMLVNLLGGDDVSEQLINFVESVGDGETEAAGDKETFELSEGTTVYRVARADAVRSYVLSGIGRVSNRENWTELGTGFYTSPDFEGAAAYASTVGKPAAMMALKLTAPATCRLFQNTQDVDGKTEHTIQQEFGDSDAVCDQSVTQIKFHNPFYRDDLEITRVWTMNEQEDWVSYQSPKAFVDAFEQFRIEQHKQKASEIEPPPAREQAPQNVSEVTSPSQTLLSAQDASPEMMYAIAYSESAQAFEKALGVFLSTYGPAVTASGTLAKAAWDQVEESRRSKLGSKQSTVTGMVGSELSTLKEVVDSGNLRERMTLIYNGYASNLFGKLERPEKLMELRAQRQDRPLDQREPPPHPSKVSPALSEREWFSAVSGKGALSWESGGELYHFPMSSDYQAEAELLLAPVGSGLSGTAYGIFQVDEKLNANVNPELLRLALLGWMLPAGDHTFHEIMTACAEFSSDLEYDPNSPERYRHIAPLAEETLRGLAPQHLFPDEAGREAKAFSLLLDYAKEAAAGKWVGAGNLYIEAIATFPKKDWTSRMKAVDKAVDTLGELSSRDVLSSYGVNV